MDPAGPEFTPPNDLYFEGRLDPTDAKYVQGIYTNRGVLGTTLFIGHGNFVMNSGLGQPGCFVSPLCAHSRAFEYFAESLNPSQKFAGYHCENLIKFTVFKFLKQKFSHEFDQIGIHSARKSGNFSVKTNAKPPYARDNWEKLYDNLDSFLDHESLISNGF